MSGVRLSVLAPGVLSSLQDSGRRGLRRLGIPWAGTLCEPWRRIANAALGNTADAPVIETFEAGLAVRADGGSVHVATAGDLDLQLQRAGEATRGQPAWCCLWLHDGDVLRVRSTGRARVGLIAMAGVCFPAHHGSRSTYARAGLGGLNGRTLAAGDSVPVEQVPASADRAVTGSDLAACLRLGGINGSGPIVLRAIAGPQDDAFDAASLQRFFAVVGWTIGAGTDRMGCRLDGDALRHVNARAADIVSDAILPGSVQVPGNGLPIVLANDAHTAGGYPKIATVIATDLPALALARPGTPVRFERIEVAAGVQLARDREADLRAICKRMTSLAHTPGTRDLMAHNLIDGVVHAHTAD